MIKNLLKAISLKNLNNHKDYNNIPISKFYIKNIKIINISVKIINSVFWHILIKNLNKIKLNIIIIYLDIFKKIKNF